jgi:hypothetical protein
VDYGFVPGLMLTVTRIKRKTANTVDSTKSNVIDFPKFDDEALPIAA